MTICLALTGSHRRIMRQLFLADLLLLKGANRQELVSLGIIVERFVMGWQTEKGCRLARRELRLFDKCPTAFRDQP